MFRNVTSLAAAITFALAAVGCAAQAEEDPAKKSEDALYSTGFICGPNGCVCDPDSDNPVDSCDGMMKHCDRIGKGMLCEPGGWCSCKFDPAPPTSTLEPTSPTTTYVGGTSGFYAR